jgi:hypothetical protein
MAITYPPTRASYPESGTAFPLFPFFPVHLNLLIIFRNLIIDDFQFQRQMRIVGILFESFGQGFPLAGQFFHSCPQ